MYKTCHFKTIWHCTSCYLALNAFFVGFSGEINLISVKIIILNHFCDLEQVLSLM